MVSHTSSGVFDPVTASFEVKFQKDADHKTTATDYIFSPASASQSSFMISAGDVDVAKAVNSAATRAQTAIQAYAAGGGY